MNKPFYFLITFICTGLIAFALFIQHHGWLGVHYPPCPLCILQRVAFLGLALCCFGAFILPKLKKIFHYLSLLFSLSGLFVALRHQWVLLHPESSCGIDPLEVFINQVDIVNTLPFFFKADGFCSQPLPPVFYLSVPDWSLLFFILFSFTLIIPLFFRKDK